MKKLLFLLPVVAFLLGYFVSIKIVYSDELDDIGKKITELQASLESSRRATAPLESQLINLRKQLANIEERVSFIEQDLKLKRKNIDEGYKNLAREQTLLNKAIRDYYIKSYSFSPLLVFLSSHDAASVTRLLAYQKIGADQDKAIITNLALTITTLEEKKLELEQEERKLASIKEKLDSEKGEIEKVVKGAKEYQGSLVSQIAALTSRQQELLAQKLGSLNLPRSASIGGGCIDDRTVDPGFSPRFAFFTYGIPHRVGMNQWGAYGRSRAGQDYRTILSAYFNNTRLECKNFPGNTVKVQGYGEKNIIDYLKGIGEMPENWGGSGGYEALKAQVVAAASYAYAYTNGGSGEICTTQECQVYLGHNKGGTWDQAVDDVKGQCGGDGIQVLVSNDTQDVAKTWYSSTFGGYTFNSGDVFTTSKPWTKRMQDTSSEVSGSDGFEQLNERAFDKDSPYFYCDWGSRKEYNKTAWLKADELADIVNVLLLAKRDSGTISHLPQMDKPNPDNVETWNETRIKQELASRGGTPFNSISSVDISWDKGIGRTTSVAVSGDAGSVSFDGGEFKSFFNLRVPANIQIVGPLYTIEKR